MDEPRELLNKLSTEYRELPEHGRNVRCCGGGGLLQATNDGLRLEIAKKRIEQANSVGAEILTSACPACNLTMRDAAREMGDSIKIMDIVEYIGMKLDLF